MSWYWNSWLLVLNYTVVVFDLSGDVSEMLTSETKMRPRLLSFSHKQVRSRFHFTFEIRLRSKSSQIFSNLRWQDRSRESRLSRDWDIETKTSYCVLRNQVLKPSLWRSDMKNQPFVCMKAESYAAVKRPPYTSVTVSKTIDIVCQSFIVTYVVI